MSPQIPTPASTLDPRGRTRRLIDPVLVLLVPRRAVQLLAKADLKVTFKRQPELTSRDEEEQLHKHLELTTYRVRRLRRVHGGALLIVGTAIAAGAITTSAIGDLPSSARVCLGISSVGAFAWATLARLGWAGQSIKGDTAIERIDETWFRGLYWVGTLLATISLG